MYSQYRVVKKTGLILRYIVLLCIFSDYYHNPVLNEQIGEEDYVTDKFTYADLKIATTWAKIFWITIQNSNFCVTILVYFITIYPCLLKCWSDLSDYLSGGVDPKVFVLYYKTIFDKMSSSIIYDNGFQFIWRLLQSYFKLN